MLYFFAAALLFLVSMPVSAQESIDKARLWKMSPVENQKIVKLGNHVMSCGYAAMLNSLAFGKEVDRSLFRSIGDDDTSKLSELEKRLGSRKSKDFPNRKRFDKDGISACDLLLSFNELREEYKLAPLKGDYLDRGPHEDSIKLGKRIHKILLKSLEQGEPPVIMLRAQVAHREKFSSRWNEITGHFLTVTAMPVDTSTDGSFCLEYLDSYDGEKHQLFVYQEERNFLAAKGPPSKGKNNWIDDYPFLIVAAPALRLGTNGERWNERTIIYLHHAIYKD